MSRYVLIALIILSLILSATSLIPTSAQETRTIGIVDQATGASSLTVGKTGEPIPSGGIPFSVRIYLNGSTSNLTTWQIDVTFDNNTLRCVDGIIPENDSSYVFFGKEEVTAVDLDHQTFNPPDVAAGAAILNLNQPVAVNNALLCMLDFEALTVGSTTIQFLTASTFLYDKNQRDIAVNVGDALNVTVLGNGSPPLATFVYSPSTPKVNEPITFNASSSPSPAGKTIINYTWNFGDNNTITTDATNITHAYSRRGFYTVNLTVADDANSLGWLTKQIQVGIPPNALFTVNPANPSPGTNVLFDASNSSASESGVTIVSYVWVFDDVFPANKTTTKSAETTHVFQSAADFVAVLTVYDSDGLYDVYSVYVSVSSQSPLAFLTSPSFLVPVAAIAVVAIGAVIFYLRRHRKHVSPRISTRRK
jgi:PKD repeat protein